MLTLRPRVKCRVDNEMFVMSNILNRIIDCSLKFGLLHKIIIYHSEFSNTNYNCNNSTSRVLGKFNKHNAVPCSISTKLFKKSVAQILLRCTSISVLYIAGDSVVVIEMHEFFDASKGINSTNLMKSYKFCWRSPDFLSQSVEH